MTTTDGACGSQKFVLLNSDRRRSLRAAALGDFSRAPGRSAGHVRLLRAVALGARCRRPTGCRFEDRNGSLRGEFVLVKQTAESVAPPDTPLQVGRRDGARLEERRVLVERAVWPMRVVVGDVLAQHRLELPAGDDQDPVETFASGAADPALGVCFRPWRRDWRLDQPEPLRPEDLVEDGREFAVAVADQDPVALPLLGEGHRQVARLLLDPGAVGSGGDAGEIHATP